MKNISKIKDLIIKILNDNKALDVTTLDLKGKHSLADYAIVATGTSSRHLSTLKDKLYMELKQANITDLQSEGEDTGNWIIIFTSGIFIHLFREEVRNYYTIEDIWAKSNAN